MRAGKRSLATSQFPAWLRHQRSRGNSQPTILALVTVVTGPGPEPRPAKLKTQRASTAANRPARGRRIWLPEDCRVGEQDIAAACICRRHPDEGIKLSIPRGGEWMRPGQIDRLPGQNMNGRRIFCCQRIVRQMQMKVERAHSVQQTQRVEILVDSEERRSDRSPG